MQRKSGPQRKFHSLSHPLFVKEIGTQQQTDHTADKVLLIIDLHNSGPPVPGFPADSKVPPLRSGTLPP